MFEKVKNRILMADEWTFIEIKHRVAKDREQFRFRQISSTGTTAQVCGTWQGTSPGIPDICHWIKHGRPHGQLFFLLPYESNW